MKDTDIAYIAGLIDADGSITVRKDRKKYKPVVSISNCNKEVLDWCNSLVGKGTLCTKHPKNERWSINYDLRWEYDKALDLAKKCLPHLIIKRERALLLLKWKSVTKRNGHYTEEEWQKKMDLINKMRELNKR